MLAFAFLNIIAAAILSQYACYTQSMAVLVASCVPIVLCALALIGATIERR